MYGTVLAVGHRSDARAAPDVRAAPEARIDAEAAVAIAATMQALAPPSRLLILGRLRAGPCSVTELAEAVGMGQSAVSHQLRLLRHLGLVTSSRAGRRVIYALYDWHVAHLLDEAVHHAEHRRLGLTDADPRSADPASAGWDRPTGSERPVGWDRTAG